MTRPVERSCVEESRRYRCRDGGGGEEIELANPRLIDEDEAWRALADIVKRRPDFYASPSTCGWTWLTAEVVAVISSIPSCQARA